MKSIFLIFFIYLLSFSSPLVLQADAQLPVPEVETLPNGLKIAWLLNEQVPVIDLSVIVHAGYKEDPDGKSGTSELVGALLDRGSTGMSALQIAEAIHSVGAVRYCSVIEDLISFSVHGLSMDANALLQVLEKVVMSPEFPIHELQKARTELIERSSHIQDYSETLANLAYKRVLFSKTVYGRGNILSHLELQKITRDDVLNYYNSYFKPEKILLTIVGYGEQASIRKRILSVFGQWKSNSKIALTSKRSKKNYIWTFPVEKGFKKPTQKQMITLVNRPHLAQAQIRLGSPTLSIHSKEYYPMRVANAILGEVFNSRFNSVLRDQLNLTYAIRSSLAYYEDFAEFTVSTTAQNTSVGPLIQKIIEILKDFNHTSLSSTEVDAAKLYLIGDFSLSHLSLNAVIGRWGSAMVLGLGPDYLNEFVAHIQGVHVRDVLAAAQKMVDLQNLSIVVAGDANSIAQSLKSAQFKSIRQVSVSDLQK